MGVITIIKPMKDDYSLHSLENSDKNETAAGLESDDTLMMKSFKGSFR